VIDSCTYPGASRWDPVGTLVAKKERIQVRSLDCDHKAAPVVNALPQTQVRHHGAPVRVADPVVRDVAEPIRPQDDEPNGTHVSDLPVWMQPSPGGNCTVCGHRLWTPQSRELGLCAAHYGATV
jgi:hypothetical protein